MPNSFSSCEIAAETDGAETLTRSAALGDGAEFPDRDEIFQLPEREAQHHVCSPVEAPIKEQIRTRGKGALLGIVNDGLVFGGWMSVHRMLASSLRAFGAVGFQEAAAIRSVPRCSAM